MRSGVRSLSLGPMRWYTTVPLILLQIGQTPSLSQAQRMKRESKQGTLSAESMMEIMRENKQTIPTRGSVVLSQDRLLKYFPRTYTAEQIEKTIYKLLDAWVKKRQQTQER